jgi:hypothetical protein
MDRHVNLNIIPLENPGFDIFRRLVDQRMNDKAEINCGLLD